MEELDKYINGDLDEETGRNFEARLDQDPDLQAELLLREGLSQWRYQEIARRAAATRSGMRVTARRSYLLRSAVAALALLVAAMLFFKKNTDTDRLTTSPEPVENPLPIAPPTESPDPPPPSVEAAESNPAPKRQTTPRPAPPAIAQNPAPTSGPTPTQPQRETIPDSPPESLPTRGDAPPPTSSSLLPLVRNGAYPPAAWRPDGRLAAAHEWMLERNYARAYSALQRLERSQPANDTLLLMKAYCLIELGEGQEARASMARISAQNQSLQAILEWYRALTLATESRRAELEALLQQIAGQVQHPYQSAAQSALDALRR